jgi:hypothetical protein
VSPYGWVRLPVGEDLLADGVDLRVVGDARAQVFGGGDVGGVDGVDAAMQADDPVEGIDKFSTRPQRSGSRPGSGCSRVRRELARQLANG